MHPPGPLAQGAGDAAAALPRRTPDTSPDHPAGRTAPGRAADPPGQARIDGSPHKRQFARRAKAVSRARDFVVSLLGPEVGAGVADDIRVCVSELATNALRHTPPGHRFLVRVLPRDGALRIEVHDAGTGTPHLRTPADTDDRGRGLRLVDALADDWGVGDRSGPGKAVWAEFKLPGCPVAAAGKGPR